jgi:hypothetical protein
LSPQVYGRLATSKRADQQIDGSPCFACTFQRNFNLP